MPIINNLQSRTGKDILEIDGYIYCKNKQRGDLYYWCCNAKNRLQCNVYIRTIYKQGEHELVSKYIGQHTHEPDPDKKEELKFITTLKRKATDSMDSPGQIMQACNQIIPHTSAHSLPNDNAKRMIIHRARTKNFPDLPKRLADIKVPSQYTKFNDEQFLIGHYIHDEVECVLVFSTKNNLKLLHNSPYWVMDGTFMTCPAMFAQLYTIHAVIGHTETSDKTAPLIYGLLSHKTHHCYVVLLEIIRTYVLNEMNIVLQPKIVLTDFEIAAIKAVKTVFPKTLQKGCFFHLTQNIWKRAGCWTCTKIWTGQRFCKQNKALSCIGLFMPRRNSSSFPPY